MCYDQKYVNIIICYLLFTVSLQRASINTVIIIYITSYYIRYHIRLVSGVPIYLTFLLSNYTKDTNKGLYGILPLTSPVGHTASIMYSYSIVKQFGYCNRGLINHLISNYCFFNF